jgi:hypothetical protein
MRARVSQLKQKVAGTPVSSLELEAFIRDVGKVSDADTLQVRRAFVRCTLVRRVGGAPPRRGHGLPTDVSEHAVGRWTTAGCANFRSAAAVALLRRTTRAAAWQLAMTACRVVRGTWRRALSRLARGAVRRVRV